MSRSRCPALIWPRTGRLHHGPEPAPTRRKIKIARLRETPVSTQIALAGVVRAVPDTLGRVTENKLRRPAILNGQRVRLARYEKQDLPAGLSWLPGPSLQGA